MAASRPFRTRFAPSPTGFLHIGGARTALFNYYLSKAMGGEFLIRIEDTDKARSTPEATQAIIDGLNWLGVDHDGEIIFQSQRADAHVTAAHALLETGKAYRCYATPQELETLRAEARETNTAFRSPYRDSSDALDKPYTVRFRVPEGATTITDHVQGEITWQNTAFDDLVLLRADGTPTYMLAVVVDDHDMGISHVVRGDDHLINAGRQTQIYQALGWDVPEWAHVPLIHGPDGKKLSKRHGALGVEAYRDMGYLPSALRNYLVKLGWSHGDEELFFTDGEIANVFSLAGINTSPARLDFDKMNYVNQQHMMKTAPEALLKAALPFFESGLDAAQMALLTRAMPTLAPRANILPDIAKQAAYLLAKQPLEISGKTAKPLKREGALDLLEALTSRLKSLESPSWTAEHLAADLQDFATTREVGFGRVGQPVRAALTGGAPAPDLSVMMDLLGREETLARLDDVIARRAEFE